MECFINYLINCICFSALKLRAYIFLTNPIKEKSTCIMQQFCFLHFWDFAKKEVFESHYFHDYECLFNLHHMGIQNTVKSIKDYPKSPEFFIV